MKDKKILRIAFISVICLLIFKPESNAQNNAQVVKDKMTTVNSWDSVIRTVDTTPTTTTNPATIQGQDNSLDRPNTRDNVEITQISPNFTANVKKGFKEPVKPNVNANVSKNQQAIDDAKANAALNRNLPTQQQIRDLILDKKSN